VVNFCNAPIVIYSYHNKTLFWGRFYSCRLQYSTRSHHWKDRQKWALCCILLAISRGGILGNVDL